MLIFNEGVPRAGKSYDAVATHILPALKAGKYVFARLNGLNHEKIAGYLNLPVEEVRERLIHVPTGEVLNVFAATPPGQSTENWSIDDRMKNALCVIDEVHEFFVAQRKPLEPQHEQFFALAGQNGTDVVILTQWFNRLHGAVRGRIERKNVFQKLTAVGMKGKYRETHYVTIRPGVFEKVGGSTKSYKPEIFPLYAGYADGVTNTEVYESGGVSVWKKLAVPTVFAAIALCFAIYSYGGYFAGAHVDEPASIPASNSTQVRTGGSVDVGAALPVGPDLRAAPKVRTEGMSESQAYVFTLSASARPRLGALIESESSMLGLIEWRKDGGEVIERFTTRELAHMGVRVVRTGYGVQLRAASETMIVTAWPLSGTAREREPTLYAMPGSGQRSTPSVSEPLNTGAATSNRNGQSSRHAIRAEYAPPAHERVTGRATSF